MIVIVILIDRRGRQLGIRHKGTKAQRIIRMRGVLPQQARKFDELGTKKGSGLKIRIPLYSIHFYKTIDPKSRNFKV